MTPPTTDCRECRAGRAQASQFTVGFFCPIHGTQALELVAQAQFDSLAEQLAAAHQVLAQIAAAPDADTMRQIAMEALETKDAGR